LFDVCRALVQGIIFGTVFWFRPMDQLGVLELFSVIFFAAVYAVLASYAFLPGVYFQRPLFARERAEGFYRTTSYVIALIGANLPLLLFDTLLFASFLYWLSGLRREADSYFFFLLLILLLTLVLVAFAHAVAVWSPNPVTAGVIFSTTFSFFALTAGFFLIHSRMPGYLVWGYWISFVHWYLESVSVSNFQGRRVHCTESQFTQVPITLPTGQVVSQPYCPITSGNQLLHSLDLVTKRLMVGPAVLFGLFLGFVILTMVGLRVLKPIQR